MTNKKYHAIGLMSGTSLDGLDIAYCIFELIDDVWSYQIKEAATFLYPAALQGELASAIQLSGLDLRLLDIKLGRWMGQKVHDFIEQHQLTVDLVASHGHTIFHQPQKNLTLQIGSGWEIFNNCKIMVVNDFRSHDVSLGGNGAPLVPIGDQLLFGQYEACLNLGGIANISFKENDQRIAFDIVPTNMILNQLVKHLGKEFDNRGNIARKGIVDLDLLENLNKVDFYQQSPPKSLGYEWVETNLFPLLEASEASVENQLATSVEHMAIQISEHLPKGRTLLTGGGVYNDFLIERLRQLIADDRTLIVPNNITIEFKEALVFAFLGVLRIRGDINCLKSVTGASADNSGGVVYSK